MSTQPLSRRTLLAGYGASAAAASPPHSRPIGANDRITMAVIGCGGMGTAGLIEA